MLRDPDRTEFRVVTTPETMAVHESERLGAKLREFDVPVATLVVNRVIDDCDYDRAQENEPSRRKCSRRWAGRSLTSICGQSPTNRTR